MSATAITLGEDGGSWFVEDKDDSTDEKAIRRAVLNLLQEQYAHNLADDSYIVEVEELATAELTYKTGWWATGHAEGEWVQDEDPPEKVSGWFIN